MILHTMWGKLLSQVGSSGDPHTKVLSISVSNSVGAFEDLDVVVCTKERFEELEALQYCVRCGQDMLGCGAHCPTCFGEAERRAHR